MLDICPAESFYGSFSLILKNMFRCYIHLENKLIQLLYSHQGSPEALKCITRFLKASAGNPCVRWHSKNGREKQGGGGICRTIGVAISLRSVQIFWDELWQGHQDLSRVWWKFLQDLQWVNGAIKILRGPHKMLPIRLFLKNAAGVDTSQLIISNCHFPMAVRVALDVIGRHVVQLSIPIMANFAESETLVFFLLYLELFHRQLKTGKSNTFTNKKSKRWKTDYDWLESFGNWQVTL